jgi:hypothetical protein
MKLAQKRKLRTPVQKQAMTSASVPVVNAPAQAAGEPDSAFMPVDVPQVEATPKSNPYFRKSSAITQTVLRPGNS